MSPVAWYALFVILFALVCLWAGHQAEVVRRQIERRLQEEAGSDS